MRATISSLILLACSLASAQLPVIQLYQNPSSSVFGPGVANLTELWQYTDLVTNNMPITNWIGKIASTVLTNGASTLQPTNSANGVMFGQNNALQYLTNIAINMGSNFTVVVRAKMTSEGFSPSSIYPMWTEFNNKWSVGWTDGTSPKAPYAWYNHSVAQQATAQLSGIVNTYIDHMMVCSNNANGAGKIYAYTNAVLLTGNFAAEPNTTKFSGVAWGGSGWNVADAYRGLIEVIEVYTAVLTPAELLTVYQWNTNHFQ